MPHPSGFLVRKSGELSARVVVHVLTERALSALSSTCVCHRVTTTDLGDHRVARKQERSLQTVSILGCHILM